MKIGIIGAGNIGSNAARLFVRAGHDVAIANSRGPDTLSELVAELGEYSRAMIVEDAAKFGEVDLVSIPLFRYTELPSDAFDGKIVIDSNNYYPERDGNIKLLDEGKTTSSELLAEHLKGARVVKGFNTIWFKHLRSQGNTQLPVDERRAIFIASDDDDAKRIVSKLIEEIGFAPIDTGGLRDGGIAQQPGTAIYNRELTGSEAWALLSSEGY
jgi:8-hydroxy-5-deazaflavin:NADPH oxidoreductase